MKRYLQKHRKIVGFCGVFVALGIATIYYFIVPEEAAVTTGLQKAILLYGHSACWVLLGVASLLWGMSLARKWVEILAYSALGIYVSFVCMLLLAKLF